MPKENIHRTKNKLLQCSHREHGHGKECMYSDSNSQRLFNIFHVSVSTILCKLIYFNSYNSPTKWVLLLTHFLKIWVMEWLSTLPQAQNQQTVEVGLKCSQTVEFVLFHGTVQSTSKQVDSHHRIGQEEASIRCLLEARDMFHWQLSMSPAFTDYNLGQVTWPLTFNTFI